MTEPRLALEMARHVRLIMALVGLLLVVGCTPTPNPTPTAAARTLDWSAVELPDGLNPSAVVVAGDALLVGGWSTAEGEHPGLVTVAADGTVSSLAVKPQSPYAKVADLASLATDGRTVYALGKAHGGAHSNFRWTTWQGSVTGGASLLSTMKAAALAPSGAPLRPRASTRPVARAGGVFGVTSSSRVRATSGSDLLGSSWRTTPVPGVLSALATTVFVASSSAIGRLPW